jgi:hypothetical protein
MSASCVVKLLSELALALAAAEVEDSEFIAFSAR